MLLCSCQADQTCRPRRFVRSGIVEIKFQTPLRSPECNLGNDPAFNRSANRCRDKPTSTCVNSPLLTWMTWITSPLGVLFCSLQQNQLTHHCSSHDFEIECIKSSKCILCSCHIMYGIIAKITYQMSTIRIHHPPANIASAPPCQWSSPLAILFNNIAILIDQRCHHWHSYSAKTILLLLLGHLHPNVQTTKCEEQIEIGCI